MAVAAPTPLDEATWEGSILRGDASPAAAAPLEDLVGAIEERGAVVGSSHGIPPFRHAPVSAAPFRGDFVSSARFRRLPAILRELASHFLCLDGAHYTDYLTSGYAGLREIAPDPVRPPRGARPGGSSIAFPPAPAPAPHAAMSDAAALAQYRAFLLEAASLLAAMRYVRAPGAAMARSSFRALRRTVHEWDAEGTEARNENTISPPGRIAFANAAGIPARAMVLPVWPEEGRPWYRTIRASGSRSPKPGVWDPPEYDYVQRADIQRYCYFFANGFKTVESISRTVDTAAETASETRIEWELTDEGEIVSRRQSADPAASAVVEIPPSQYEGVWADGGGVYEVGVPYDLGEVPPREERSFEAPGADPAYVAGLGDTQFQLYDFRGLVGLVPILDYGPYFQHRAADAAAPQPEPESNP